MDGGRGKGGGGGGKVGDMSDSLTQRFWHAWDTQCNLQHVVKLHKSEHSEHVANEKLWFFSVLKDLIVTLHPYRMP